VVIRPLAFGVVLVVVSPLVLAARQAPTGPSQAPATVAEPAAPTVVKINPELKYPVTQLETALVNAVRHGAQRLAEEINQLAPELPLYTGPAKAKGFPEPGYGVFFDVEIPSVNVNTIALYLSMMQDSTFQGQPQPMPMSPVLPVAGTAPPTPVSNAERSQRIKNSPVFQDPTGAYHVLVREALVDTMLDFSSAIPLKGGEWLTVAARGVEGMSDSSSMILRIKQEDLVAFRAGKFDPDPVANKDAARKCVQVIVF
jgi:hypothetical protein